jgi:phosphonate transport system substrate-binding protein
MRHVLLLVLAVGACAPFEDPAPPPALRDRVTVPVFAPPAGFERLRFGVVPYFAPDTISAAHQRLASYLSKTLSVPVDVVVGGSYSDSIERVARGEFDLVELSPYAYAKASARAKLRCLAQSIADGSATASGYIFVRDDSPRRTLADLKGASVAFVDPASTSGYLYARKLLKDQGIDFKTDLGRTEFLGNHESVLLAVRDGRFDAGATFQGAFAELRRSKNVDPLTFRVIGKTPRTPRDIFCVREAVPEVVAEAITRALLALDGRERAGREILGPLSLNGFRPADDAAYDNVRKVALEIEAE